MALLKDDDSKGGGGGVSTNPADRQPDSGTTDEGTSTTQKGDGENSSLPTTTRSDTFTDQGTGGTGDGTGDGGSDGRVTTAYPPQTTDSDREPRYGASPLLNTSLGDGYGSRTAEAIRRGQGRVGLFRDMSDKVGSTSVTTREVQGNELVQEHLNKLLSGNSDYMRQAKLEGVAMGGGLGGTQGVRAAMGAAIKAGMPIAAADADAYRQAAAQNMDALNAMSLANLERQTQLEMANMNANTQWAISELNNATQLDMGELDATTRLKIAEYDGKIKQWLARAEFENAMALNAQQYGFDVNKMKLGHVLNLETMEQAQLDLLEQLATQHGYKIDEMTLAQTYTLAQMAVEQGYTLEQIGLAGSIDLSKIDAQGAWELTINDQQISAQDKINFGNMVGNSYTQTQTLIASYNGMEMDDATRRQLVEDAWYAHDQMVIFYASLFGIDPSEWNGGGGEGGG